jgi:hypothetical protein
MTAEVVSFAEYRAKRGTSGAAARGGLLWNVRSEERRETPGRVLTLKKRSRVDHRAEPRYVVQGVCASALWLNGEKVEIKNISQDGVMVAAPFRAAPGARLLATIPGCRPLSARVIWERDGLIGLEVPIGSMELAPL